MSVIVLIMGASLALALAGMLLPYRDLSLSLFTVGLVLLGVGLAVLGKEGW